MISNTILDGKSFPGRRPLRVAHHGRRVRRRAGDRALRVGVAEARGRGASGARDLDVLEDLQTAEGRGWPRRSPRSRHAVDQRKRSLGPDRWFGGVKKALVIPKSNMKVNCYNNKKMFSEIVDF